VTRQEKVRHARTHALHTTLSLHDPFPVDTHQVKFNSATAPRQSFVLAIVDTSAATGENEAFAHRQSDIHPRGFRRRPQASSTTLNRMNKMDDAACDPPTAVTRIYPPIQTSRPTKPVQ